MAPIVPLLSHVRCGAACEHVSNGTWHINAASAQSPGAKVLLARRAANVARSHSLLDNPRVLNMYGERSGDHGARMDTLVCEEGRLLDDFLAQEGEARGHVAQVLRDALVGLCSLHDQGFAHRRVDASHIVVGEDKRGNLLAPFWRSGTEPEPEACVDKEKGVELEEKAAPPVLVWIARDLAAFAECAASKLAGLQYPGETDYHQKFRAQLALTLRLLEAATTRVVNPLEVNRTRPPFVRAVARLAELETKARQ